ncbi:nucleotidyltransferase family protein [Cellulomonas endophytica]|uniref:nucleotidyltransferase family protein n=1 Tax=Cellulomonas endophytica TaxID=2494735 RepID=UPI0010134ACB|nr:NTP transferase domain-containing protein [Cellulomonas endophytica]
MPPTSSATPAPGPDPRVVGVVLAAGAGARAGGPKALRVDARGSWLRRAVTTLRDGGCDAVLVVLGAAPGAADLVADLAGVRALVVPGWSEGVAASLRGGLRAVPSGALAAVVVPVDVPDLPVAVVRRLLDPRPGPATLRRAVFGGRPGHPVVVGRDHRAALAAAVRGDAGGRAWLGSHGVADVECGDLHDGRDEDGPPRP